jgi:hypothetical protein
MLISVFAAQFGSTGRERCDFIISREILRFARGLCPARFQESFLEQASAHRVMACRNDFDFELIIAYSDKRALAVQ